MVKTAHSSKWKHMIGDRDIAGRCGDAFTVNGVTVEIIGYTNAGSSYLVKCISDGQIYQYTYRAPKVQ